jgi:hypothetical protein
MFCVVIAEDPRPGCVVRLGFPCTDSMVGASFNGGRSKGGKTLKKAKMFLMVVLFISLAGCTDVAPSPSTAALSPASQKPAQAQSWKKVMATVLRCRQEPETWLSETTRDRWRQYFRYYVYAVESSGEYWDINALAEVGKIKYVEPGDEIMFWLDESGTTIELKDLQWAPEYRPLPPAPAANSKRKAEKGE